jgi:iron complex transport system substrate-binding protein
LGTIASTAHARGLRALGTALLLFACAQDASAAQPALRDDRGTALPNAGPPQRIVSLLPSLTESVCALGGCAKLVGTDSYSNWPAAVLALPKLGGLDDAQLERIAVLKPDLVLATPGARVTERLEALGIPVIVLRSETHADVRRTLLLLAVVLGHPDDGPAAWARIERELNDAARRVPAAVRGGRVYFEVGAPYAAGASSFIGETLARLQMGNIVPAELGPFPSLNPEFVVRAQPDIVMALAREIAEMARRPGWNQLRALKDKRTCAFDAGRYEILVRPGPRMGEAAMRIADCLVALGKQ